MGAGPTYTITPGAGSSASTKPVAVGYARAAGLYCVINLHHDGADGFKGAQWLSLKDAAGNTTDENDAAVLVRASSRYGRRLQSTFRSTGRSSSSSR